MDLISEYNKSNSFGKENNLSLQVISPGHIEYTMQIENKHMALNNVVHGGAIAGLMDAVLSVAAFSAVEKEGMHVSTVEFKINYLKPVSESIKLKGIGKVLKLGKRLIVTKGEIFDNENNMIAIGTGTIIPFKK